jgi:hypothetical protein
MATPSWKIEQLIRKLDEEIAALQERRIKLLTLLAEKKEAKS